MVMPHKGTDFNKLVNLCLVKKISPYFGPCSRYFRIKFYLLLQKKRMCLAVQLLIFSKPYTPRVSIIGGILLISSVHPAVLSLLNCVSCGLKTCSRANVSYVPCMLTCLHVNVPCMLTCLVCSRANVLCVLTCSTCQRALSAYVLVCERAILNNVKSNIIQI